MNKDSLIQVLIGQRNEAANQAAEAMALANDLNAQLQEAKKRIEELTQE